MSTARRCDSVILCTQGCMLKHSLGAFSSGKMTLGPNERDTSSITYCGRSLASSAPFRGGVVDGASSGCASLHGLFFLQKFRKSRRQRQTSRGCKKIRQKFAPAGKSGIIYTRDDSVNLRSPSPDVDGVSDSLCTSGNLRTDGQPEVGRGFPSIDEERKISSIHKTDSPSRSFLSLF